MIQPLQAIAVLDIFSILRLPSIKLFLPYSLQIIHSCSFTTNLLAKIIFLLPTCHFPTISWNLIFLSSSTLPSNSFTVSRLLYEPWSSLLVPTNSTLFTYQFLSSLNHFMQPKYGFRIQHFCKAARQQEYATMRYVYHMHKKPWKLKPFIAALAVVQYNIYAHHSLYCFFYQ